MPKNMAHFDQFESQKIDFLHVRQKFSTTKLDYPGKSRKTPSLPSRRNPEPCGIKGFQLVWTPLAIYPESVCRAGVMTFYENVNLRNRKIFLPGRLSEDSNFSKIEAYEKNYRPC